RTVADSIGTGDCAPATASWASRRSPATFSACIMMARLSASMLSSDGSGASRLSSSTAWRRKSASRCARSTSARWAATAPAPPRPRTPLVPKTLDLIGFAVEGSKGIEQAAVRRGIHQRALVVLPVDLDQRRAQRFQGLRAQRLVIDEGTGAAVGKLHTTQNQLVFGRDVVFGHERAHRMPGGELERRSHLALLSTVSHQRDVAARAERQGEGIEQDGLAGAGLPREH